MTLVINGQPEERDAKTLLELIVSLGFADAKIATAHNGSFVPVAARRSTALSSGDRIEIVAPMQGG